MGSSKRVLILEAGSGGHHPFLVRCLLESELRHFADLVLAGHKELFSHPAIAACSVPFQQHTIDLSEVNLYPKNATPVKLFQRSWTLGKSYRRAFIELAQKGPIDFVIVPYLDNCLLGLAAPGRAFGQTPWLTITMRTMFHFQTMGVIAPKQRFSILRRALANRILRQPHLAALLTIDPTLGEFASLQRDTCFRKIQYIPDPVVHHYGPLPSKMEAKLRLNIPTQARVVLLYGAIDERKGVTSLVEAAAAADCSTQVHLVLAGEYCGPEELRRTKAWESLTAQRRLHVVAGFITEENEKLLLAAADCMWIGYIDFYGVSGVMALAGRHGIPIVGTDYGLVGYYTKKFSLGALIDPRNQASTVAALNRLVMEPEFFRRAGGNGVAVFQHHNPLALQQAVVGAVERKWAERGTD